MLGGVLRATSTVIDVFDATSNVPWAKASEDVELLLGVAEA